MKALFLGTYRRPRREERAFVFLDLTDSTAWAERLGPLRFTDFKNDFFADVAEPVLATGGRIVQYVGDEVMVSWPMARALKDAAPLRFYFLVGDRVAARAERYRQRYGEVPRFKAGVHGGWVVTAEVGDLKRDIVHSGDVVNTAARIEGECRPRGCTLLVSDEMIARMPPAGARHDHGPGARGAPGQERTRGLGVGRPHLRRDGHRPGASDGRLCSPSRRAGGRRQWGGPFCTTGAEPVSSPLCRRHVPHPDAPPPPTRTGRALRGALAYGQQRRLQTLLAALGALLFLSPFLGPWGGVAALLMVAALLGVLRPLLGPTALAAAASAAALHVGLLLAFDVGAAPDAALRAGQAAGVALYGGAAAALLHHVLSDRQGTAEALYGSACVYLLAALAWALAYAVLAAAQPGAFTEPAGPPSWADLLYFSVSTLTTVGYGDVTAVSAHARALVMAEAVAGVFYLAIVVARVVTLADAAGEPDG